MKFVRDLIEIELHKIELELSNDNSIDIEQSEKHLDFENNCRKIFLNETI